MKKETRKIKKHRDKIAILPDWSKENPYQNALIESLEKQGAFVSLYDFPTAYLPLNRLINQNPELGTLHLHWINEYIASTLWSNSRIISMARMLLLAMDIILVRIRGVSVIWTIHNSVSHESKNKKNEIISRKIIATACTRIIIHSKSALKEVERIYKIKISRKTLVIPHGNYDGHYNECPTTTLKPLERIDEKNNIVILFFGIIRPYKGVDKLIHAFRTSKRKDIRLLIAGKCHDPNTREIIDKSIDHDKRIECILDFIPKHEVKNLFIKSDIVAIPFEKTLTSGSTILALTMGRPLLLPEIAKVFDLADEDFSYFFKSIDDLSRIIDSLEKNQLRGMRDLSRKKADSLSWDNIGIETLKAYKKDLLVEHPETPRCKI